MNRERQLNNEPGIIYQARLHWIIFLWPTLLFIAGFYVLVQYESLDKVAFGIMGFAGVWWLMHYANYRYSYINIKQNRIVLRAGVWVRQTIDLPMAKIESVDITQNILGSMLGYGSMLITGTGGSRNLLEHVKSPLTCRRLIEQMMHEQ